MKKYEMNKKINNEGLIITVFFTTTYNLINNL